MNRPRRVHWSLVRDGQVGSATVITIELEAVGMVPQSSKSGSGRDMVYTGHMQKGGVRKFHTIAYGGQTVSAVSGSVV